MRLLWSQSMQRVAFHVFHCTTLMTMFVKNRVVRPLWLLDQRYKLVPRILFLWYHQLYRFVWGIRSAPTDTHWTCHTYLYKNTYSSGKPTEYVEGSFRAKPVRIFLSPSDCSPKYGPYDAYDATFWYDMIRFAQVQAAPMQAAPMQTPSKFCLKESYSPPRGRIVEVVDMLQVDPIVISKCDDVYTVKFDDQKKVSERNDDGLIIEESVDVDIEPPIVSKIRFLSIEYSHAKMGGKRIELKIPTGMMMVGNELLTPTFVLRLLEHTVGTSGYHFDLDYTLSLMDSQIRMFEMRSHQFLVLHETSYMVEAYTSFPASSPKGTGLRPSPLGSNTVPSNVAENEPMDDTSCSFDHEDIVSVIE